MEYSDLVRDVFSDGEKKRFITDSLRDSMTRLGFSGALRDEFLRNIDTLTVADFIGRHKNELQRVQNEHFFGELVPVYFKENVVPEIPAGGKVLDLGCGPAILIRCLIERGTNPEIVGSDIAADPRWSGIVPEDARLEVVRESEFLPYLKREQPDHVAATWVFHHMEYAEQERYLSALHNALKPGATLVVLEDSYSEVLLPESGRERALAFMRWSPEDRHKIMGALDWIANRIFSMRTSMPVPFAYRTLEGWAKVFEEAGFSVKKTRFLGFPDNRDIHTPQSLIVAEKR
ncbi:MAG: class I SAM-dependent methyltransferase [Candidatus Moranbacteria bacterium]|nr:class I SAM-dependent methyltransferase [Candidatus Moranbacteria bacterium]NTW45868.1 class I SAM-dependent methyltransferase [Candidatus Moranbacteria bacterium]